MDRSQINQLTEQMLLAHGIRGLELMNEIMEVEGKEAPPLLSVEYIDADTVYIKGEQKINNFINSLISKL